MGGLQRLGVGVLLVCLTLAGCGRQALQLAPPATQTLTFEPTAGGTLSATSELIDMGNTLEFRMTGTGFSQTGVYSLQPLRAYASATSYLRSIDALPEPMPVTADGGINVVTSFQHRGGASTSMGGDRWVAMAVFYNPDGNLSNQRGAQLVLVSPLPTNL